MQSQVLVNLSTALVNNSVHVLSRKISNSACFSKVLQRLQTQSKSGHTLTSGGRLNVKFLKQFGQG